jgi:hypothetical protein
MVDQRIVKSIFETLSDGPKSVIELSRALGLQAGHVQTIMMIINFRYGTVVFDPIRYKWQLTSLGDEVLKSYEQASTKEES